MERQETFDWILKRKGRLLVIVALFALLIVLYTRWITHLAIRNARSPDADTAQKRNAEPPAGIVDLKELDACRNGADLTQLTGKRFFYVLEIQSVRPSENDAAALTVFGILPYSGIDNVYAQFDKPIQNAIKIGPDQWWRISGKIKHAKIAHGFRDGFGDPAMGPCLLLILDQVVASFDRIPERGSVPAN